MTCVQDTGSRGPLAGCVFVCSALQHCAVNSSGGVHGVACSGAECGRSIRKENCFSL